MNWEPSAAQLAAAVTHPASRWQPAVTAVPRHLFAPRWWEWAAPGPGLWHDQWELRDGPADAAAWLDATYADRSLITQVGPLHADHARPADRPEGQPTSSATLPGLLVQMYRHAMISDSADVLDVGDVGTGSGYGTALLCKRLEDNRVTSIDVDEYLTKAAAERLGRIGLHPQVTAADATGPLPGTYDRIVSTVAVRPVPASWLTALRPGGRLVTTITGTTLILTADKTPDGGATGRTEWDRAGFMHARTGPAYPPADLEHFTAIRDARGDQITIGRVPRHQRQRGVGAVLHARNHRPRHPAPLRGRRARHPNRLDDPPRRIMGTRHHRHRRPGTRHPPSRPPPPVDPPRRDPPQLAQGRSLPAYGARVTITPDGTITLKRGSWEATIPAGG